MPLQCTCLSCGRTFPSQPSIVQKGKGHFCSRSCSDRAQLIRLAKQRDDLIARDHDDFLSQVDTSGEHWLWTGRLHAEGYGLASTVGARPLLAHVAAWEAVCGPVPKGMLVCHTCDIRTCTRNDDTGTYELRGQLLPRVGHLFLGTRSQNIQDMWDKGRSARGEDSPLSKLTMAEAIAIRAAWLDSRVTSLQLAEEYHVAASTIRGIVNGYNWRELGGPLPRRRLRR